jgi:hypothetical protein
MVDFTIFLHNKECECFDGHNVAMETWTSFKAWHIFGEKIEVLY